MLLRIDATQVAPQAWRNGGGVTRELLAWPSGGDWQLRLSLADIERDGPFSPFPGVRRHFAVLTGAGVALRFGEGSWHPQRVGDTPLAFNGAEAPDCRLLDGPTRDLNLMLRGGLEGGMALQPDPRWTWRGLFTVGPAVLRWAGGAEEALPAWSALLDLPAWPQVQALSAAPVLYLGCVVAPGA